VAAGQDLTPRQAAVLAEVCQYRDSRARAADLPAFKVLSNQLLVQVAQTCPATTPDLVQATGLNGRQLERHGDGLLQAVKRGLQAPPLRRPVQNRPDERYLNRLEHLKSWRRRTGMSWGVESDVILPREVMEAIALNPPDQPGDLEVLMASVPWRLEHFGSEIMRLFR
jgi:ribonuclease D